MASRKRLAAAAAVSLMIAVSPGSSDAQPKGGAPTAPAKPDKAQLAEARKHMEAGAAFYNDPSGHKCEEAYREFLKAYELSGSLKALKAVGICALELERDGDAIERFEKYLADIGKPDADTAQVESDLKALKSAVARVTFKSDRQDARITDVRTPSKGSPVTNDYSIGSEQTLGIHPGRHTFTASLQGAPPLTWTTEIANGGTYEHMFDFAKAAAAGSGQQGGDTPKLPPRMERPVPIAVFVLGGLTAALAVPTVIFMVRAGSKNDEYKAQNGKLPEPTLSSLKSDVTTANAIADVFLGATVVSLAATGVFYFTRPARPVEKTSTWTLAPAVGRSGGGALLLGTF